MANMSYCRMRNTYSDLNDCFDAIENRDTLNADESVALKEMINAMYYFLNNNCLMNEDGLDESAVDELIAEMEK